MLKYRLPKYIKDHYILRYSNTDTITILDVLNISITLSRLKFIKGYRYAFSYRILIPKTVFKSSVDRNKIKRQIRCILYTLFFERVKITSPTVFLIRFSSKNREHNISSISYHLLYSSIYRYLMELNYYRELYEEN